MNLRRKRLRLMRDTQWRGYARTAEGNPITLSQVRSVANLSVLGNSTQDGTPSPDNPVEVVGSGERTGNLFDTIDFAAQDGVIRNSDGSFTLPQNRLFEYVIEIAENTEYTLSVISNADTAFAGLFLTFYNNNMENIGQVYLWKNTTLYNLKIEDVKYIRINGTWTPSYTITFKDFMIVEGTYTSDTIPKYEPYGYKLAVHASGRNLFDLTDVLNSDEYIDSNYNKSIAITPFHVVEGQKYILITKGNQLNNEQYASIYFGESDLKYPTGDTKIMGTGLLYYAFENNVEKRYIMTATKTCDITHCMIHGEGLYNSAYKVEEFGVYEYTDDYDTMSYEPYKEPQTFNVYTPEPLHGVGDAHNTVLMDFDNKKAELIKRYKWFKIDQEQWLRAGDSYDGINTTDRYHNFTGLYSGKNSADDSKCNVLPKYNGVIWNTDEQGFTWNSVQLHLRVNNDVLGITTSDTAEERTSKFTSYTQNNDIYVLGKLITPVVTDITALQQWDKLPQLCGTWVLTATVETEPTIAAEYYSEERSTSIE